MQKLYRSKSDAMIAGVCGGLGQYFGIDSVLVRVFFVLAVLLNGLSLLVYFVLLLVMPVQPADEGSPAEEAAENKAAQTSPSKQQQFSLFIGGALVLWGVFKLLQNFDIPGLEWINTHTLWPVLLIIAGAALLFLRAKGD